MTFSENRDFEQEIALLEELLQHPRADTYTRRRIREELTRLRAGEIGERARGVRFDWPRRLGLDHPRP